MSEEKRDPVFPRELTSDDDAQRALLANTKRNLEAAERAAEVQRPEANQAPEPLPMMVYGPPAFFQDVEDAPEPPPMPASEGTKPLPMPAYGPPAFQGGGHPRKTGLLILTSIALALIVLALIVFFSGR